MLWITNFHFSTECRDVSNLRRQAAGQRRPVWSLPVALSSVAGRDAARRGNVVRLGISASARGRDQRAMVAPSPAGRRRHVRQRSLPVRPRGRQCCRARLRAHRWDQARTSQCPCGSCPLESHPPQRARSALRNRQFPAGSCRGSGTSACTATPTAAPPEPRLEAGKRVNRAMGVRCRRHAQRSRLLFPLRDSGKSCRAQPVSRSPTDRSFAPPGMSLIASTTTMDLFTREPYTAFHGAEPPQGCT